MSFSPSHTLLTPATSARLACLSARWCILLLGSRPLSIRSKGNRSGRLTLNSPRYPLYRGRAISKMVFCRKSCRFRSHRSSTGASLCCEGSYPGGQVGAGVGPPKDVWCMAGRTILPLQTVHLYPKMYPQSCLLIPGVQRSQRTPDLGTRPPGLDRNPAPRYPLGVEC